MSGIGNRAGQHRIVGVRGTLHKQRESFGLDALELQARTDDVTCNGTEHMLCILLFLCPYPSLSSASIPHYLFQKNILSGNRRNERGAGT